MEQKEERKGSVGKGGMCWLNLIPKMKRIEFRKVGSRVSSKKSVEPAKACFIRTRLGNNSFGEGLFASIYRITYEDLHLGTLSCNKSMDLISWRVNQRIAKEEQKEDYCC